MTEELRDATGNHSTGDHSTENDASENETTRKQDSVAHPSFKTRLLITLLIFLGFLAYSLIQMPIPAPNEPHYLIKAKHFWNPQWCQGDLFLESSNPHLFFYQTFGILAHLFEFEQAALLGRMIALLFLAYAWQEFVRRVTPGARSALWSSWIFLAITVVGNFSGEWLIGGVEGKIPSYACVFLAWALYVDRKMIFAAAALGFAFSFHPVVGAWSVAGILFVEAVRFFLNHKNRHVILRHFLLVSAVFLITALPGLWASLSLMFSPDGDIVQRAAEIQVFDRLAHHLNPSEFSVSAYWCYSALIVVWLIIRRWSINSEYECWFFLFVLFYLGVAAVGLLAGWGLKAEDTKTLGDVPLAGLRLWFLRFYPFRMADLFVPIAVSISIVGVCRHWLPVTIRGNEKSWQRICVHSTMILALIFAISLPTEHRNPSGMSLREKNDWIVTCQWIRDNTPRDAMVFTSEEEWAFKRFAQRKEYVSNKDFPQDAKAIIEWDRRKRYINNWALKHWASKDWAVEGSSTIISIDATRLLYIEEKITHIVCHQLGPFEFEPIFVSPNKLFRVYDVKSLFEENK